MNPSTPTLIVLAGPNGAGKTRLSPYFVSSGLINTEPVNTDQIAQSVDEHRFSHDLLRIEEQRLKETNKVFMRAVNNAIKKKNDFSFESNISTKYQLSPIAEFDEAGYNLVLIYVLLSDIELSNSRVKQRVHEKGHYVDPKTIRINFVNGLKNMDDSFDDWDRVIIIDNSADINLTDQKPQTVLIADKGEIKYHSNFPNDILSEYLPMIKAKLASIQKK